MIEVRVAAYKLGYKRGRTERGGFSATAVSRCQGIPSYPGKSLSAMEMYRRGKSARLHLHLKTAFSHFHKTSTNPVADSHKQSVPREIKERKSSSRFVRAYLSCASATSRWGQAERPHEDHEATPVHLSLCRTGQGMMRMKPKMSMVTQRA